MKSVTYLIVFSLLIPLLILQSEISNAQQVENVDEALREAQELAFKGNREESRRLARAILEIAPNYHDVRVLIARTYSWDGMYQEARSELNYVLEKNPRHKDAFSALIDVETWSENYEKAADVSERAIRIYTTDDTILIKRAETLINAGRESQALSVLDQAEQINPSNQQIQPLRQSVKRSRRNYTLTASYTRDWFEQIFNSWNTGFLQISRPTGMGTVIGRLGFTNRFGSTGFQPEIDFYPKISGRFYGFLNAGYSDSFLFPEYRLGGELFSRLPGSFEGSLGVRFLNFAGGSVTIFTGNLTKYWRNWMFTVRPFVTPSSVGISQSANVTARRYFSGADDYISFRSGGGFSSEERRFQDVSGNVFFVKSWFSGIDGSKTLNPRTVVFGAFDFTRQELTFDPGNFNTIITLNAGFRFKFGFPN